MTTAMQHEFEEWWDSYPRKVGKLAAMKAYAKARKTATAQELREGIGRYMKHKPSYADYAHPQTWLNQGRWMDQYGAERPMLTPTDTRSFLESIGHWSIDCERLHGGTCQSGNAHYDKRDAEQAMKAQAS